MLWRGSRRRYRHQASHNDELANFFEQTFHFAQKHAAFGRFGPQIDLDQYFGLGLWPKSPQTLSYLIGIETVNKVEAIECQASLVALQMSDKMPLCVGQIVQLRPLAETFLNIVFTKNPDTRLVGRAQSRRRMPFACCEQFHAFRTPTSALSSKRDAFAHLFDPLCDLRVRR